MAAPEQLALPFAVRTARGRGDFIVAPSSRDAVAMIDTWPAWPGSLLLLAGPAGSGKSHLAAVWAAWAGARTVAGHALRQSDVPHLARGRAVALDAFDGRTDQVALFHLVNAVREGGGHLLVAGQGEPADWPVTLPDLRTRLMAAPVARLDRPDEAFMTALLVKLFADRQLAVVPAVIGFLTLRLERSHAAAVDAVARIDAAALSAGRNVTVPLVRDVLWPHGSGHDDDINVT